MYFMGEHELPRLDPLALLGDVETLRIFMDTWNSYPPKNGTQ
jgi:hypothetical protein